MIEILCKFVEHLLFVILCFIIIWGVRKSFLFVLKNTIKKHIFYSTKEESIKNGKCGIKLVNVRKINDAHIPLTHTIGKFDWVDERKDFFCIRIVNPELEHRPQIDSSIILQIKSNEIPVCFGLKLFLLRISYKVLPNIFKSGEIKIKASKKMLLVLEDKMNKISTFIFNMKNIKKDE